MSIRYTASARRNLRVILTTIASESPQGANRVAARIVQAETMLQDHPFAGPETNRKGVRRVVLGRFPYVLFYRVTDAGIVVTDVRHAARRPGG